MQSDQSIDGQLAAAKTYAEAHGYEIIREYVDRAMTGRNDNRLAFQQMLSDCAKHDFDVIIVWKVDRFGRNREEITYNKYRARRHGVTVEYVAESVPDSPEGVILESVLEGMAEYYSLQMSQNIRRGHRETAKAGRHIGGAPPLGYTINNDGYYEVDPLYEPVVQKIFRDYAAGMPLLDIVRELNRSGLERPGGKDWNCAHLRSMLHNKKYMGVYEFDDIVLTDAVPAIVDADTWHAAQEQALANRGNPKQWVRIEYLLTGKVFCGRCGAPMIGSSFRTKNRNGKNVSYNYYRCRESKNGHCRMKGIKKDVLERVVIGVILQLLGDDETINTIVDSTWDLYQRENAEDRTLRALNAELERVQTSIQNLIKSIEAGVISEAVTNRLNDLSAQQEALQRSIEREMVRDGPRLTKDHIRYFLERMRDGDLNDPEIQKRLIHTFLNSVYVYDDSDNDNDDDDGRKSRDHAVLNLNFNDYSKNIPIISGIARTDIFCPLRAHFKLGRKSPLHLYRPPPFCQGFVTNGDFRCCGDKNT